MSTEKADAINAVVTGWMEPVLKEIHPITGAVLNGLGPEDFNRVRAGYGCPNCLAIFKMYTVKCPVCDFTRDVEQDFREAPQFWVDHLKDRHADDVPAQKPVDIDTFISEVMKDPNIEQRKL